MPAGDLTSARLAAPPLPPLAGLSGERLIELGELVLAGTWRTGLTSWFWGEGVCLLGMIRLAHARNQPIPGEVVAWLCERHRAGIEVTHVNNLAPGTAAVLAAPGNPDLAGAAERLGRWFRESPDATRVPNGALEHWPGGLWADTTFMAGVFLGHLGEYHCDATLLTEFGDQMLRAAAVVPQCPGEIIDAGWRAAAGALAHIDPAGMLTRVSAGTVLRLVPFGYSVIRDDRPQPWGQGLALHAIAAALTALRSAAAIRP